MNHFGLRLTDDGELFIVFTLPYVISLFRKTSVHTESEVSVGDCWGSLGSNLRSWDFLIENTVTEVKLAKLRADSQDWAQHFQHSPERSSYRSQSPP